MADFKLCISESGKTFQKEVKDADTLISKKIGDKIEGKIVGLEGFELEITGGSDKSGFPMRKGILGIRKKLTLKGGVGISRKLRRGEKIRRTVCGHKINENISQINLKVTKSGSKKLEEIFNAEATDAKEEKK